MSKSETLEGQPKASGRRKSTKKTLVEAQESMSVGGQSYAKQRAAQSRASILAAAESCFLEHGYSVSMDEIIRQSGVSKATMFAHFTGKEMLFQEVMKEIANQELPLDILEGTDNYLNRLRKFCGEYVRAILAGRTLSVYRLVMNEAPRHPELAESHYVAGMGRVLPVLARFFACGIKSGIIRKRSPELLADQFIMTLLGGRQYRAMLGVNDVFARSEDYVSSAIESVFREPESRIQAKPKSD